MSPETITLPGETSSVPPARRFVERTLGQWDLDELRWTAALLVSELAANACLHAGTALEVSLVRTASGVRLEVRDGSVVVPRMRRFDDLATTGRGVRLLGDLAHRWGVEQVADGKVVWAELACVDGARHAGPAPDDGHDVDRLLAMFPDEAGAGPASAESADPARWAA